MRLQPVPLFDLSLEIHGAVRRGNKFTMRFCVQCPAGRPKVMFAGSETIWLGSEDACKLHGTLPNSIFVFMEQVSIQARTIVFTFDTSSTSRLRSG